jgi:hypothetical protein
MYDILDALRMPEADDCEVLVQTVEEPIVKSGARVFVVGWIGMITGVISLAL